MNDVSKSAPSRKSPREIRRGASRAGHAFASMAGVVLAVAVLLGAQVRARPATVSAREPARPRDQSIEIVATEFKFDPADLTVAAGEAVTVTLRNAGSFSHDIVFELDQDRVAASQLTHPGETAQVGFEAPVAPGDYVFYCSVSNHRERGMEGTLHVVSAGPTAVVDNLKSPRGLAVDGDRLLIAEGGTGDAPSGGSGLGNGDGRVTSYDLTTGQRAVVVDSLPNAVDPGGGVVGANAAVWRGPGAASDTVMVALAGGAPEREPRSQILAGEPGGPFGVLADVWGFETEHNPDGGQIDSNPWRVIMGPDGRAYISDAGGNAVLAMDPDTGSLSLYAVFEPVGTRGDGSKIQAVPTGLAFAPTDPGVLYVALLGSFDEGAAQVRRLEDLNGDGDATDDGENTAYVTELTTAVDVAMAPDGGLYVLELGGVAAVGQLSRVAPGGGSVEVVAEGLPGPSALTFTAGGDALVAEGEVGSGTTTSRVVRYAAADIGVGAALPTPTPTSTPGTPGPSPTIGTPGPTPTESVTPTGVPAGIIYLPKCQRP